MLIRDSKKFSARTRVTRGSCWLVLLLVSLFGGSAVFGHDYWPTGTTCGTANCSANNLMVGMAGIQETVSCTAGKRTGHIQIYLSSSSSGYYVRVAGNIRYSDETVITSFDWCTAFYSGSGWVTVLSDLQWDCDKSIHLQNILISWQTPAGSYACGATMPCSAISPMCFNQGNQEIGVTGTEPLNIPVIAWDDETSTTENTSILVDVVANDTDPEGHAFQVVSVTTPSHGSAVIAGNMVQYTPALFFHGDDQFEYTVRDAGGAQASASVFVHVIPANDPPIANAGIIYQGMTGEEILFDARFSSDPDVMDILEYRWDLNGDGEWETEWLTSATFGYVYPFPYRGLVTVQVRDRHLGVPNGTTSEDSAFALIQPKPTQIAVSVYVDLNGNGEFDEGDVGLPGVSLLLDGEVELYTGQEGTALADDVAPGGHIIRISEAGIAYLQERGFYLSEEALASVEVESGDWVALFFSPEARGFLEIDLGAKSED